MFAERKFSLRTFLHLFHSLAPSSHSPSLSLSRSILSFSISFTLSLHPLILHLFHSLAPSSHSPSLSLSRSILSFSISFTLSLHPLILHLFHSLAPSSHSPSLSIHISAHLSWFSVSNCFTFLFSFPKPVIIILVSCHSILFRFFQTRNFLSVLPNANLFFLSLWYVSFLHTFKSLSKNTRERNRRKATKTGEEKKKKTSEKWIENSTEEKRKVDQRDE